MSITVCRGLLEKSGQGHPWGVQEVVGSVGSTGGTWNVIEAWEPACGQGLSVTFREAKDGLVIGVERLFLIQGTVV